MGRGWLLFRLSIVSRLATPPKSTHSSPAPCASAASTRLLGLGADWGAVRMSRRGEEVLFGPRRCMITGPVGPLVIGLSILALLNAMRPWTGLAY